MIRLSLCLIVILIAVTAPASDHVALDANFNLDAIGDWPSLELPGGPEGDAMEFDNRLSSDETTAYVEASWYTLDDKPLVIDRRVGENITLYFHLDPAYVDCGRYTITWTGGAGNPLEYFYITVREDDWTLLASLDYRVDGVLTYNNPTNQLSVGWAAAVPQEFRLYVDAVDRASDLWIDGAPVPEAQGATLMHALPNGTVGHLTMNFGYSSAAIMAIDDLRVVAHCGDVANEAVSWSELKTSYR